MTVAQSKIANSGSTCRMFCMLPLLFMWVGPAAPVAAGCTANCQRNGVDFTDQD
jgi:hypothetical protein